MRRKRRGRTAALITWAARALAKTRVAKEKEKKKKTQPKTLQYTLEEKGKGVSHFKVTSLHSMA